MEKFIEFSFINKEKLKIYESFLLSGTLADIVQKIENKEEIIKVEYSKHGVSKNIYIILENVANITFIT